MFKVGDIFKLNSRLYDVCSVYDYSAHHYTYISSKNVGLILKQMTSGCGYPPIEYNVLIGTEKYRIADVYMKKLNNED